MAETSPDQSIYKGIAASPGVAHGRIFVFVPKELEIPSVKIRNSDQEVEIDRFEKALLATRQQILKVQHEVAERLGEDEARIFDAHLLVLEDKSLIDETIRELEESKLNIAACFHAVSQRYIDAFDRIDDEYLRERAVDIRDVSKRLLVNLLGTTHSGLNRLTEERVLVAHDVSPSDTANMEKDKVLAIVTDGGSKTSHAVIMARSLQVPAVVGLRDFSRSVQNGDWVLVDGYDGLVIVNPSEQTLFRYGKLQRERKTLEERILADSSLLCQTLDGVRIQLMANIEGGEEIEKIHSYGADGVGLFRTEYLFLQECLFPSEDEQFASYRKVAEEFGSSPVIIRTLDLGGDKLGGDSRFVGKETNPFLGQRAIRFCLEHPGLFKDQLRAILRASAYGNIKLMYPMISGKDELDRAGAVLEEAKAELREKGIPFNEKIPVGSMIEIPSAAVIADILAKSCDFFSIGTNDLIQYLLAIDRVNERIAHLYEPTHPAVLRLIKMTADYARAEEIPVGVCGEMAGDPVFVPLLIGLGVDELSVVPSALPRIKYVLRNIRFSDMEKLAVRVLEEPDPKRTIAEVEQFYHDRISGLIP